MTRQELILPSQSVPWGRWAAENSDETSVAIQRQVSDSSSAGSVFSAQTDLLSLQVRAIPSVAAIYERDVLPFSVTRSSNPNAVRYVYNSATVRFNAPRPDRPYSYRVVANMSASGNLLTFSQSLLRVNGVENSFQHENLFPGGENQANFSILGSGAVGEGEPVDVVFAIAGPASGTLNFDACRVTCIFSGSIL